MRKELRATVIIKKASQYGSARLVRHVLKPEVFRDPKANERDLRDRLLHAETNLPIGLDRTNPAVISKVLDSHFEGRAQRNHLSVVISVEKCQDPEEYADGIERVRKAARAWLARFAPNSKYVLACHGDKFHPHVHLVVCNWDPKLRRSITFSPRALIYMNSLDWCPPSVGLIPGAGLYAQAQDFKAPKTASMRELVDSIKTDPAGRLQAMLEAGEAKWYSYPSKKDGTSNWGLAIDGRRFSMAGISYALRQLGAPYGVGHKEGRVVATALPKPTRTPCEQQNRAHLAMGVHYGQCSREEYETYLYDHDVLAGTSPEEQAEIHAFLYGSNPDPISSDHLRNRVERLTNGHLKRRLIYGQRRYDGPNGRLVGYLYDRKYQPSPGQREMAGRLSKDFLERLPLPLRKLVGPWEEFRFILGASEKLGRLMMPDGLSL
jgi:hypothetical protein